MMIASSLPRRTIPTGLGQAVSPETLKSIQTMKPAATCTGGPAAGCFPSWCSWLPFADFADACKVPTKAEQDAAIKADIEKAAGAGTPAYNPDLAAQQYEAYLADSAAYCEMHPAECSEYQVAGESPTCSGIFGAGPTAQGFCKNPGGYLILGAAAVVGLILFSTSRKN